MQLIDHTKDIITLRNVSYSYDKAENAVAGVSLSIHEGDYLGIIGPNGGGKSTLMKLILGLLSPDSGTITKSIASIGYVAQDVTHFDKDFPISVHDVVAQGRIAQRGLLHAMTKSDQLAVAGAIKEVGLEGYAHTLIGNLSGGQQQRAFIARAIAGHPPRVIFLDEPTTGIDEKAQIQFYALLKRFHQQLGMTLVLIAHDIERVKKEVSHIALINQKLIYFGDPKESPYG